jgi:prophage antirepressor-like protein
MRPVDTRLTSIEIVTGVRLTSVEQVNGTQQMKNINQHANPFIFSNNEVRTATDDKGEVWFCAKDVFEALGVIWKGAKGSLTNCPEKWQGVCYLQTPGGTQEAIFITEAAVYQTAFRSNKPEAVEFANWVCEEVLPALRKQGYFGLTKEIDQVKGTNAMVGLLRTLSNTKDAFSYQLLTRRLRNLCNAMGEPMPDIELLGKDRHQLDLI